MAATPGVNLGDAMIGVSGTNGRAALGVFLGARTVPVAVAVDMLMLALACGPGEGGASRSECCCQCWFCVP